MNNSDHAARAKKPVLPPKNRSVARPKNRKQINSIIANTTLFVFKDAMVPKIEKIKKPTFKSFIYDILHIKYVGGYMVFSYFITKHHAYRLAHIAWVFPKRAGHV